METDPTDLDDDYDHSLIGIYGFISVEERLQCVDHSNKSICRFVFPVGTSLQGASQAPRRAREGNTVHLVERHLKRRNL